MRVIPALIVRLDYLYFFDVAQPNSNSLAATITRIALLKLKNIITLPDSEAQQLIARETNGLA